MREKSPARTCAARGTETAFAENAVGRPEARTSRNHNGTSGSRWIPARWGFEVQFPVTPDGSPRDARNLLRSIVTAANDQSKSAYRLDENGDAFSFVPTRTHDVQGRSIAVPPLLDRPVTIPPGVRRIHESASLMAEELSKQTGLQVNCCQSFIAGYPWGMEEVAFAANGEQARAVLRRLGLNRWHARCDEAFCFIDMR